MRILLSKSARIWPGTLYTRGLNGTFCFIKATFPTLPVIYYTQLACYLPKAADRPCAPIHLHPSSAPVSPRCDVHRGSTLNFAADQRLLMGNLGSAQLDSTIACSIMFLCDACTVGVSVDTGIGIDHKHGKGAASGPAIGAETATGVAQAREGDAGSCGTSTNKHAKGGKGKGKGKRKKGAKETNSPDWGVWSQKQLTSLVWALGHGNQDVLTYTAWTV